MGWRSTVREYKTVAVLALIFFSLGVGAVFTTLRPEDIEDEYMVGADDYADSPDMGNVSYGMNTTYHNTTGYHYVNYTMPDNSFGPEYVNVSSVNWSYFWGMFRANSAWNMQGWHPVQETWVDDYQGTDLDEYLNISRVRAYDNASEKITLNFTSPYTTQYRFTFGIDARVLQYVNKTGQLEYELVYPINGLDENYTVFFNWSDLIPMLNNNTIRVNHGIKNVSGRDVFWFRIITNVNLTEGVSYLLDPTFGDTSTGPGTWSLSDDVAYCNFGSPSSSGTVDNITVYFRERDEPSDIACAIHWASNLTMIPNGQTDTVTVSSDDGFQWYTFDFSDPKPSIYSTVNYCLAIGTEGTNTVVDTDATGGDSGWDKNCLTGGLANWPSTLTEDTSFTYVPTMYASYTEGGGPVNTAPVIGNGSNGGDSPSVWNESWDSEWLLNATDVTLFPTSINCSVNDSDGDTMNLSFWTNESGSWSEADTNNSISNGTYYCLNTSWVDTEGSTYWISFNVSDGTDWTNQTFQFTVIDWSSNGLSFGGGNVTVKAWGSSGLSFSGGNDTSKAWSSSGLSFSGDNTTVKSWSSSGLSFSGGNTTGFSWQSSGLSISGGNSTSKSWSSSGISFSGNNNTSKTWSSSGLSFSGGNATGFSWQSSGLSFSGNNVTSKTWASNGLSFSGGNTNTWQSMGLSFSGGNITVPDISIIAVFPDNGSVIPMFQPTLVFTISHAEGATMNYTIYTGNSSSNCTTVLTTGSGVGNGTFTYVNYFDADNYTSYWWRVYVNGSGDHRNESFVFGCGGGGGQMVSTPGFSALGFLIACCVCFVIMLKKKHCYDKTINNKYKRKR